MVKLIPRAVPVPIEVDGIVDRALLQVAQHQRMGAPGPSILGEGTVGENGAEGEAIIGGVVVVHGEAYLLQIVDAGGAARLARRLHGGEAAARSGRR